MSRQSGSLKWQVHGRKDVSKRMTQKLLPPNKPDHLGHLPLALDQMASFILERGCTIASFQRVYSDWQLADRLQCTTIVNIYICIKTVAAALALFLERLSDIWISNESFSLLWSWSDPSRAIERLSGVHSMSVESNCPGRGFQGSPYLLANNTESWEEDCDNSSTC